MIVEPPEAPVSKEFCKSRDVTVSDNRDGNELDECKKKLRSNSSMTQYSVTQLKLLSFK